MYIKAQATLLAVTIVLFTVTVLCQLVTFNLTTGL